ncbi:MAG: coenzyme F420-0:L-glutamate ligase [Oscillospiraceae bacterium]|nr:coenzyme F420-0:L-glutamate ligase [Oscillospiraceae bacterium]
MRTTGTVARGIRAPLIKTGDDIAQIVADSVMNAVKEEGLSLNDRDVVGVTEAVVARAQGNYASCAQIALDVKNKFPSGTLAITFPILSRNRFSNVLKGIARSCDKLYILLSYPADEVGNELVSWDMLDEHGVNPYADLLTEEEYREKFGFDTKHVFTNVDYVEHYKSYGEHVSILFANDVRQVLKFTKNVLCCDVHTRFRSKRLLKEAGAEIVYGLDEILSQPVSGSGYNERYGLLGSNKSGEDTVKLFPRDCENIVSSIAAKLREASGKNIEVLIYGDGAFKDPVGKIWELADPIVSPAATEGLMGTPSEIKLKLMLDNEFAGKSEDEVKALIGSSKKPRAEKSIGTTPRRYTDLIGSLCDLISGSGDKGTPVVLIQGYFDNFAS